MGYRSSWYYGIYYSNYWQLGHISKRTTKTKIKEYRNKYDLAKCFTTNCKFKMIHYPFSTAIEIIKLKWYNRLIKERTT